MLSALLAGCNGGAKTFEVIPQAVDFPGTAPHSTTTTPLILANQASFDVTLTPQPITGPQAALFSTDQTVPFTVAEASAQSINVTYSPIVASTDDNAELVLMMSSGGSITVPLHGVSN